MKTQPHLVYVFLDSDGSSSAVYSCLACDGDCTVQVTAEESGGALFTDLAIGLHWFLAWPDEAGGGILTEAYLITRHAPAWVTDNLRQ